VPAFIECLNDNKFEKKIKHIIRFFSMAACGMKAAGVGPIVIIISTCCCDTMPGVL
jgi:hypothetical protein